MGGILMLKKVILAGAVAAFGLAGASAQAADKIVWDYSWWGNPRAVTQGTTAVADFLAEKTGGNFELKIHYGGAVSPPKQNLDNIKRGAIHAGTVCTGYHPGKNPIGSVGDLPFLPFSSWNKLIAGHEAIRTNKHFVAEMKKWGGMPWYSNILPQYEFFGVGDPPKNALDWEGKTVRALGGIGKAMTKLGAALKSAPAPEAYELLERGVVQAWSFPYSYTFGAYRLHEISEWYTTNFQPGTNHCPTVINLRAYKKLPDEYKALLDEAIPLAYKALVAAYEAADKKWIPIYEARKGLTEIRFEQADLDAVEAKAGKPVWDEWVAERNAAGQPGQEVLDAVLAAANGAT
jgi:TRAP-type mannitol/chloroaromatic compound transport system substrate-binding protein